VISTDQCRFQTESLPSLSLRLGVRPGGKGALAAEMDAVLHAERLAHGRKRLHALPSHSDDLPDGTVIVAAGEAYTLAHGCAFRWTPDGYERALEIPRTSGLVTPPSTLGALRAGYRPVLHHGGLSLPRSGSCHREQRQRPP
jgi:hypothetical protein